MGQWLIADLSVSDIHFQAWVFLVAGIVLLWFPLRFGNAVVFAEKSKAWAITKRQCERIPFLTGSAGSSSRKWHHT
jgi:hypothetical protein